MKTNFLILLTTFLFSSLQAQENIKDYLRMQSPIRTYQAKQLSDSIKIDGIDNEQTWKNALWTSDFIDIEGDTRPHPTQQTAVKIAWDTESIYFFAKLQEKDISASLRQHDTIIYKDNDFELFLKPNILEAHYYEIEVNALNTIMDLMMLKPYRFTGRANLNWNVKGLESAVKLHGTLNNPKDQDKYWTVEMKIPVKSLALFGEKNTLTEGDRWKINFSRVQWKYEFKNGRYEKIKEDHQQHPVEDNWVWSPIGVINMHYPERWGLVTFVKNNSSPAPDLFQKMETHVWNMHYLQKLYFKKHQKYAADWNQLRQEFPETIQPDEACTYTFAILKHYYHIKVALKKQTDVFIQIDSNGNLTFSNSWTKDHL